MLFLKYQAINSGLHLLVLMFFPVVVSYDLISAYSPESS